MLRRAAYLYSIFGRRIPAFDPATISSLKVWLRASDIVGADRDTVATWADRSGNGNDFAQAVAGNRPMYMTGVMSPTLIGGPVVRGDGVDNFLDAGNVSVSNTNVEIWYVGKATQLENNATPVSKWDDNGEWQFLLMNDKTLDGTTGNGTSSDDNYKSTFTVSDSVPFVAGMSYDNATKKVSLYTGASTDELGPAGTISGLGTNADLYLFARNAGGSQDLFTPIDIAEVLVFSDLLSASNRASLRAYLIDRYRLFFDNMGTFTVVTAAAPLLDVGANTKFDDTGVTFNSVAQKADLTYHAYYQGEDSTDHVGGFGLATSADGTTWARHSTDPIFTVGTAGQWDDFAIGAPVAWREGASWYMIYSGNREVGTTMKLGLATSSDGITWARSGSNPVLAGTAATWDAGGIIATSIIKVGSTYHLFYWALPYGDGTCIGKATSTDLITWTKEPTNPILEPLGGDGHEILSPNVFIRNAIWYMFYQEDQNAAEGANQKCRIHLASATDGINFTRLNQGYAVLPNGQGGEWDSHWRETPVVLAMSGANYNLYYDGTTTGFVRRPGLATWVCPF